MRKGVLWRTAGILLAFLTTGSADAESICLTLTADGAPPSYFDVVPGEKLSIHFFHSIYGSVVEEEFHIAASGFLSSRLRYGEPRLVEFYGHESSREENGRWVVVHRGVDVKFLDLHVSSDAAVRIVFRDRVLLLGDSTAHLRARLTVSVCPVEKDD